MFDLSEELTLWKYCGTACFASGISARTFQPFEWCVCGMGLMCGLFLRMCGNFGCLGNPKVKTVRIGLVVSLSVCQYFYWWAAIVRPQLCLHNVLHRFCSRHVQPTPRLDPGLHSTRAPYLASCPRFFQSACSFVHASISLRMGACSRHRKFFLLAS